MPKDRRLVLSHEKENVTESLGVDEARGPVLDRHLRLLPTLVLVEEEEGSSGGRGGLRLLFRTVQPVTIELIRSKKGP